MPKFLISACLAGESVRYDGKHCLNTTLKSLLESGQAIMICPEVAGGLKIPRLPAEILGGDGHDVLADQARVINVQGEDVTSEFILGAQKTLAFAQKHQVTHVVLKSHSPSCGSGQIYDGTFSGQKINGVGVTSALLQQHGFQLWTEHQFLEHLNTKTY